VKLVAGAVRECDFSVSPQVGANTEESKESGEETADSVVVGHDIAGVSMDGENPLCSPSLMLFGQWRLTWLP